jgi:hypothetical protein
VRHSTKVRQRTKEAPDQLPRTSTRRSSQSFHSTKLNFRFTEFSAPLCQAALREGARESATRLLKTASEMRLLRQRNASLRDLPSAIFLR